MSCLQYTGKAGARRRQSLKAEKIWIKTRFRFYVAQKY